MVRTCYILSDDGAIFWRNISDGGLSVGEPTGWIRPEPALGRLRRIELGLGVLLVVILPTRSVLWLSGHGHRTLERAIVIVGAGLALVVVDTLLRRQIRSRGFVETADAIVVTRGALVRATTVIPYGRIQFLSVSAGPVARYLGLATLRVGSASTRGRESIRGLRTDDAALLRHRLEERARTTMRSL
ncbi:MAG: PH domain-containing protein [Acidimicrobiaceae bacterium]|nr:PH domain-containing protein [Acidimicrobiaceae bacterium]